MKVGGVDDVKKLLDMDGIVNVKSDDDLNPSYLLLSTPSKRIGIFGSTHFDAPSLDIREVPFLCDLVKRVIEDNIGVLYLQPNDSETWGKAEKLFYSRLAVLKSIEHDGFGVHICPTIEQIDANLLTGYVSFCYSELRVVYGFGVSPGDGILSRPVVCVEELIDEFPVQGNSFKR